ncbi:MAG: MFS transporter [Acidimicrobiia bacterium]|nr:MFS transporter [Acidimicrobiia bacterium]
MTDTSAHHQGQHPGASELQEPNPERWRILLVVCSGLFATGLTITALTAAAPFIRDEFGTTRSTVSWVVTAPFLLRAVFVPAFGRASDIWGHRRTWLGGFAVTAFASLACGFAPNIGVLIALRCIAAIGSSAVMPSAMALIVIAFPENERSRALGWWSATTAFSPLLGVILGGFVVDVFSWRWLFWGQFPFSFGALLLGAAMLTETPRHKDASLGWFRAGLLVAGLSALLFAISQGEVWGWWSAPVVVSLVLAPVLLTVFVRLDASAADPLLPLKYLKRPPFLGASLANFWAMFCYMGAFYLVSEMLADVYAYSPSEVSLAVSPRAASLGIMGPIAGALIARYGERLIGVTGMALIAASMFALAVLHPGFAYWELLVGLIIAGFGLGMISPAAASTVANETDEGDYGAASGMLSTVVAFGQSVGIAVLTALVTLRANHGDPSPSDYSWAFQVGGWLCMIGVLAAFWLPRGVGRSPRIATVARSPEDSAPR